MYEILWILFLTTCFSEGMSWKWIALIGLSSVFVLLYWSFFHKSLPTNSVFHRLRYVEPTTNNPAGNILPYHRMVGSRSTPVSHETLLGYLKKGIPIPPDYRIFGVRFGARETVPVDNIPDKEGYAKYLFDGMESCKEDRMACMTYPNSAISSRQLSL